ncbi:hypothetical protein SLA2020_050080 [Shorea laevis]
MKVVTWNSRGVKYGPFRRECKELIKMHRPDIICLLETKVDCFTDALSFLKRFNFDKEYQVPSQGKAGGLWLFWRSSSVCLEVLHSSPQLIHCSISQQQVAYLATFVYVQPHAAQKDLFWNQLNDLAQHITNSWVVMGDFNDILTVDEVSPRATRGFVRAQRFRDRIASCGLHSTAALGCKFTWVRKQNGRVVLRERLDRALFNFLALESFTDAKVINLPRLCSDHHPVLLCLDTPLLASGLVKPIRFEAAWLTHDAFKQVFTEAWLSHGSLLPNAIKSVQEACMQWNKNVFGDIFRRKRQLKGRLQGIQNSVHYTTSHFLQGLEMELLDEYHRALHAEELFWCQKSRVEWTASGDRNTKFYHASTVIRRGKNRISALKIDGTWEKEPSILKHHIQDFFVGLFTKQVTQPCNLDYSVFQPRLSDEDGNSLLLPASLEEVRIALFSMKALKSPGPDGIQPIFYQKHWDVVSGTLLTFINNALVDGFFDCSLLQAHIALIPKGENPDVIQKFRPICLLNVAYKVLSKVLVNRLRPFLQQLIGPFQNSFLAGRSTTDNVILTQETVHSMRKLRGRKGALAFKIDLHKAFDSVDWDFLRQVLVDFNIPASLIKLIMFSVTSLQLSVLWNGEELPPFQPQRGLRQGDPLSPYLFIMVMEKLSHKIQSRMQTRAWKPFRLSRRGLALSHLFFADDLMLFCDASHTQVEVVMDCLQEFSSESGLHINLNKSKLYVSPNIQRHMAGAFSEACGIPLTSDLGIYLGVPILHGRSTASTYKYILEKIQIKLSNWKQKLLSLAGRRILVQSVTTAIPAYTMQSVLLPNSVCEAIDRLNRNFLWGSDVANKPHLVGWNTVCLPRDYGGLGIRSARDNNRALVAKLGWKLLSEPHNPWCRALSLKYLQDTSLMHCPLNPSSSATWKSVLRCRDVLKKGLRWSVGSGQKIKLWTDIWVGDRPLLESALVQIPSDQVETTVSHVITPTRDWNIPLLQQLFPEHMVEKIMATPISVFGQQEDQILWDGSLSGAFSVKSAFYLLQQQRINLFQQVGNWRWIWKLQCAERIKIFVWLLMHGKVLTNSLRFERHFAATPLCPRCEQGQETALHLLRDCYYSRLVWENSATLPADFFLLNFEDWIRNNAEAYSSSSESRKHWSSFFLSLIWTIWKSRNALIFEGRRLTPQNLYQQASSLAMNTRLAFASIVFGHSRVPRWVRWFPPDFPFLKLNTDGAMNHSTGKASAGGLIRDHGGRWIHGFAMCIGQQSSYMAELWGCREGLRLASCLGITHLILEMDSLMAVQMINARKAVVGLASALFLDIFHLIQTFSECRVQHTLREGNSAADRMASIGQHLSLGVTFFDSPPADIHGILSDDDVGTLFLRA